MGVVVVILVCVSFGGVATDDGGEVLVTSVDSDHK